MNPLLPSTAEWVLDHRWALMFAACAGVCAAAACAAAVPWSRTRARAWFAGSACAACLVATAGIVWARCSDYGLWYLARIAEPVRERFTELSFQHAHWSGPAARQSWLRQAVAEGAHSGEVVALPSPVLNSWLSWISASGPRCVPLGEHLALLEYAEQVSRHAMTRAVERGDAKTWFAVRRSAAQGMVPGHLTVSGANMRTQSGYGGEGGLVPEIDGLEFGVVVRSVEWRDSAGVWHPLLDRPAVQSAHWRSKDEGDTIVQTADVPAVEVRCTGEFVIAAVHELAHRTVAFEWYGPVE